MSVEIATNADGEATKTNGDHVNGVQNGYSTSEKHRSSHKSSSKDKHRDKDRDRHSSSKHSSSSGKDKHSSSKDHHRSSSSHKSSSKDKERSDKHRSDKDRSDKDRGDKDRSDKDRSDKDKEKSRSDGDRKDKDRRDKDKDRHKDGDRKDRHDKDKHKSSSDKDKDKKSSSSSSKDHKSSSSSSRDHKSSKSGEDRHRSEKDKHRSSSSSKHHSSKSDGKEKSSSHESEKRSSGSHKPSSEENAEKLKPVKEESQSEGDEITIKKEEVAVKESPDTFDDVVSNGNLNATASSCDYSLSQFKDEPEPEPEPEEEDVKMEPESEEDVPLSARADKRKAERMSDSDEEEKPLSARKKSKPKKVKKLKIKKEESEDDEYSEEEVKPKKKKKVARPPPPKDKDTGPAKRKKKPEEQEEVWKWWEEEKKQDGTKWTFLEHKGPLFFPPYERLPKNVEFRYDGKVMHLSADTEEVAGFYSKMLDHDYTQKAIFNNNFFEDWRKVMTSEEKSIIKDLKKCNFKSMHTYFMEQAERNRNRTKEEKAALKAKNEEIVKEYGFCTIDGHKEKIGNFRIEPPGLFRGRGEHPKMGKLKKRVVPGHVMINCSKDSNIPKPPDGTRWKEVKHDNTVTWLASWTENVQNQVKYVMLNPSSKLKGEKDWQKYETARKLHKCINNIRSTYKEELKSKEMRIRQRAVALYFIDKLALRAGNEKDEDQADTVGCCSLRVEHIELHKELNGKEYVVVFDFLGKDSIRYYNEVEVEKRVFKNLELFKENKKEGDDLFDRLNTTIMNEHLKSLMDGLSAKVFRTYNASITLQNQLEELTDPEYSLAEMVLTYNRANRAVAVLCNHQRAVPKTHEKSMGALKDKISQKNELIDEAESELRDLVRLAKKGSVKEKLNADKKKKALEKLREQLKKLEVQETDRDENKTIALGTSKLNYLDPRISIAWCKKYDIPLEKIYNKTQRDKFRWAIDMATADYVF